MNDKIYKIRASNGTWVNKIFGSGYIATGATAKIWQSSTHVNNAMDKCDAFSEKYPEITFELKSFFLVDSKPGEGMNTQTTEPKATIYDKITEKDLDDWIDNI